MKAQTKNADTNSDLVLCDDNYDSIALINLSPVAIRGLIDSLQTML